MNKQIKKNKVESTKQPTEAQPLCQVETDVRPRKTYKRLLVFTIERTNYPGECLIYEIPHALREYADAVEHDEIRGDIHKFYSSNHCVIKVIHGSYDLSQDEIRDESNDNDDQ